MKNLNQMARKPKVIIGKGDILIYANQIIHSISHWDVEGLSNHLSNKRTYMEMLKNLFIKRLGCVLNYFIKIKATPVRVRKSVCAGCTAGSHAILFISEKEKKYLAFVF